MRFGVHVRIHTDTDGSLGAEFKRHLIEHFEFRFAFYVEAANAGLQCGAHLRAGFAHA